MTDLCAHEDDPTICPVAECNPRGTKREPYLPSEVGPRFDAQFDGHCRSEDCNATEIVEGEPLRMVDGSAWHAGCAEALLLPPNHRRIRT